MTTPEWQPEVTIDEALVRRLVGEQFHEVAFHEAYGAAALTPARLLRARVLALSLNGLLARYALDVGNDALLAETIAGLDRTVIDVPGLGRIAPS